MQVGVPCLTKLDVGRGFGVGGGACIVCPGG